MHVSTCFALRILYYTREKQACLSISFHFSPYFVVLLNWHTDWKMLRGANRWGLCCIKLIQGFAGGWMNPMLCEWCLPGNVLGGYFNPLHPHPTPPLGELTRSRCWHGKQTWNGMVWSGPPKPFILRGATTQLPHPPHMFGLYAQSDAMSYQSAGWYAGHSSRVHTPQWNRIPKLVAII